MRRRGIAAIGEKITRESADAVQAARSAYDALTDTQKALVTNYPMLEAAEDALIRLEELADYENLYAETGELLMGLGTPGVGSIGGEWAGRRPGPAAAARWTRATLPRPWTTWRQTPISGSG